MYNKTIPRELCSKEDKLSINIGLYEENSKETTDNEDYEVPSGKRIHSPSRSVEVPKKITSIDDEAEVSDDDEELDDDDDDDKEMNESDAEFIDDTETDGHISFYRNVDEKQSSSDYLFHPYITSVLGEQQQVHVEKTFALVKAK